MSTALMNISVKTLGDINEKIYMYVKSFGKEVH